jgi:hypothetical protein
MGAVHGVYLKYVGLSAISYAGYSYVVASSPEVAEFATISGGLRMLYSLSSDNGNNMPDLKPLITYASGAILKYSYLLNGTIACLFKLEKGMALIGKNSKTGQIPFWSYVLYFPFHLPSILYTKIHARNDRKKKKPVPTASEVQPGWWVGGRCYIHSVGLFIGSLKKIRIKHFTLLFDNKTGMYADTLGKDWGGIIGKYTYYSTLFHVLA